MISQILCEKRKIIPMHENNYSGYLLAIEGLDGTGKTTTINLIKESLIKNNIEFVNFRHPTSEARTLPLFNKYLFSPNERKKVEYRALLALLLSDRLQHAYEHLIPALLSGKFVIMDRYIYTLIVMMRARGYNENWLIDVCTYFPKPDSSILLDAPYQTVINRIKARSNKRDSYVEEGFFQRIQEEFRIMASQGELNLIKSDCNTPQNILQIIYNEIKKNHKFSDKIFVL